ncbi:MAG: TPM domain-containing protein [Candidatus Absconditabacteria bacterium]
MKKLLSSLLLVMITLSIYAFQVPPRSPRLVTDYIGLLSPEEKNGLEQKLLVFEKQTSIQIAVITLDDLDGEDPQSVATEFIQQWGIGQKKLDNGVVLLVVKYSEAARKKLSENKHGSCRIGTGYGVEEYLTDAKCKKITAKILPYVKQDNYSGGINMTIDEIIKTLGTVGWEQRQTFEKQKVAKAKEDRDVFLNALGITMGGLILLGLLIFFISKIQKERQKKQVIEQKKASIRSSFKEAEERYTDLINSIPPKDLNYPDWAVQRYNTVQERITATKIIKIEIGLFENVLKTNPEDARKITNKVCKVITELQSSIDLLQEIPIEVQKYRNGAKDKLANAESFVTKFSQDIDSEVKKGFILTKYQTASTGFTKRLETIKNSKEENNEKAIWDSSVILYRDVVETHSEMNTIFTTHNETEQILKSVEKALQTISENGIKSSSIILDELKSTYPEDNWKDLETNFSLIPAQISTCQRLLTDAKNQNSMGKQEFNSAKLSANKCIGQLDTIQLCCRKIKDRKAEILLAKDNYQKILSNAEKSVENAKQKINHPDVKDTTKSKYNQAQTSLQNAKKNFERQSVINWILSVSVLSGIIELSQSASNSAQNDISDAENARETERRRIKRQQEEIQQQEQQRQRRQREEDERRNTSYTSSFSNDNSNDSFSGFGGGDSGGGGGGTDW